MDYRYSSIQKGGINMSDVDKLVAAILAIGEQDAKYAAKQGWGTGGTTPAGLTALRRSIREAQELVQSLWLSAET